jgi:glycine cleavage system H lipoate-binding protein
VDPYGDGWIVNVEMVESDDVNDLMSVAEYEEYTAEEQE